MQPFTAPQEQVLALISAGSSVSDAAQTAGVHRNTIHNWVRSVPDFRLGLARAREAKAVHWHEQAELMAPAALDAIRTMIADLSLPAGVRLKAALSILAIATTPAPEPLPPPPFAPKPIGDHAPRSAHAFSTQSVFDTMPLELPAPPETPQTVHNSAQSKTGRNDLCPCGSGKKFKRCCLDALHRPALSATAVP